MTGYNKKKFIKNYIQQSDAITFCNAVITLRIYGTHVSRILNLNPEVSCKKSVGNQCIYHRC